MIDLLSRLVQIPSVNPDDGEAAVLNFIEGWLSRETDAELTRVELEPGRQSLAAVLPGSRPGSRLVLNGHMDTVGIGARDLWDHDPFGGSIVEGKVYGRGSCDMKGGLAVAMWTLRHFSGSARERLAGELVAHFAAGEERGEPGTRSLIEAGFGGDFAIVLEPTEMRVATAGRGLAFFRITLSGRSGHAGSPDRALNPLDHLPAVFNAAEGYRAGIEGRSHPLLPRPTLTPTTVAAGASENAIPGTCRLTLDRRLIPGEEIEVEAERLHAAIRASVPAEIGVGFEVAPGRFEPAESDHDGRLAGALRKVAGTRGYAHSDVYGVPYASDFSSLAPAVAEAVVFGPGSISLAHAENEHIPIAELEAAAGILGEVVEEILA